MRQLPGALHAVEIRDGKAVSYLRRESDADAGVFWHAGSVLALPESGLPSQYSRLLEPEEFSGWSERAHRITRAPRCGRRQPRAVRRGRRGGSPWRGREHRQRATGVGSGADESEGIWLRLGEWEAGGDLRSAQSVALERATWQHDIAVTRDHVVFIESPTTRLADASESAVPFGWVPGAEGWVGVVRRGGDGTGVRWFRVDPCLVTHVLGAWEIGEGRRAAPSNSTSAATTHPRRDRRSTSRIGRGPRGDRPERRSAGAWASWSDGGSRASGSSGCRSTSATSSIPASTPSVRVPPSATGTASRRPGATARRMRGGDAGRDGGEPPSPPSGLLKFDLARNEVAALEPGAMAQCQRADLRPSHRRAERRRGLAAHGGRRREQRNGSPLRPRCVHLGPRAPRGDHPPARTPASPQPWRVGAGRPLPLSRRSGRGGPIPRSQVDAPFAPRPRPFMLRMATTILRDGPRPDTVSRRTETLVASVTQHHRAISAHQSQLLDAVVELDRRKAWRVDGATVDGGLARPTLWRHGDHRS